VLDGRVLEYGHDNRDGRVKLFFESKSNPSFDSDSLTPKNEIFFSVAKDKSYNL
jgi:hypothetical protein